ncbi:MAG: hypothetical protein JWM11_3375, partial [Planctomycetaceae bacterium]|nr:hypothetical protein [Planctomycetaceae bacterium]
ILMGFILPAVMSSFKAARNTQISTELRGLESAIAQFKSVYGVEPPSRILLYQNPTGTPSWQSHPGMFTDPITGASVSYDMERVRSRALITRIWPNFDFTATRNLAAPNGFLYLRGAECLVFFLGGGVVASPTGAFALTGFSKNPLDPLSPASGSESRDGPFFEFKPAQLKTTRNTADAGSALIYVDPTPSQTLPYLYLSSYEGRGYSPQDALVNPQAMPVPYPANTNLLDVYRVGNSVVAQKNKSFQLISPGADGAYGSGGPFDANATNRALNDRRDYDNITNFNSGVLNSK